MTEPTTELVKADCKLPQTEQPSDWKPLLDYMQSEHGHEVVSRVLQMIEDVKRLTLEKNLDHAKHTRWLEAAVIAFVVCIVAVLGYLGKLDSTVAVLLGSVVGYFFGRSKQ